ncbi:uncharacterized protein LOC122262195 [Penaeus japonicus]|uniref:uncharacterized protein LOC122262195 n=1 Tax=Penaeus japonicus TaxID=27405 RepID=UPI001C71391C|nr:uncharacterized protein LOC122262195 [Penaeus japonicus]
MSSYTEPLERVLGKESWRESWRESSSPGRLVVSGRATRAVRANAMGEGGWCWWWRGGGRRRGGQRRQRACGRQTGVLPLLAVALVLAATRFPPTCMAAADDGDSTNGNAISNFRGRNMDVDYEMPYRSMAKESLNVGFIMPLTRLRLRKYQGKIRTGLKQFNDELGKYRFGYMEFIQKQFQINPSPTKILDTLCKSFLPMNVSAIIYTTTDESFGRNTASAQYFLQLAGYLGIPVIAWNADNSGLEQDCSFMAQRLEC